MKNYEVNYDVVTAVQDSNGTRKVIDVTGKRATIANGVDGLDVHGAICALEGKDSTAIVITAVSSSDVVPN